MGSTQIHKAFPRMHLHSNSNKQHRDVSWYITTVTNLYNMLSTRLKVQTYKYHYSPVRDGSAGTDQMKVVLLDVGLPLLSSGRTNHSSGPKYRGVSFYCGMGIQWLFPALKGKCICYSTATHLWTNTRWQYAASRSVLNLHRTPPRAPASCDNTMTHPPEGWIVPCVCT